MLVLTVDLTQEENRKAYGVSMAQWAEQGLGLWTLFQKGKMCFPRQKLPISLCLASLGPDLFPLNSALPTQLCTPLTLLSGLVLPHCMTGSCFSK
jgi:hypothetical protein